MCSHIAVQSVTVSHCCVSKDFPQCGMAESVVEDARSSAGAQRPKSEFVFLVEALELCAYVLTLLPGFRRLLGLWL